TIIIDYVHVSLLQSPLGAHAQAVMDDINRRVARSAASNSNSEVRPSTPGRQDSSAPAPSTQAGLLKRTASYLFTLPFGGSSAENSPPGTLTRVPPVSPGAQRSPL